MSDCCNSVGVDSDVGADGNAGADGSVGIDGSIGVDGGVAEHFRLLVFCCQLEGSLSCGLVPLIIAGSLLSLFSQLDVALRLLFA